MKIPDNVKVALNRLAEAGYEAFLVGGCVRDFVRGVEPSDYDMTTPSTPDETKAVFDDLPVFLQGEKHGTVGVIINGEKLEITTHRHDGEYLDHRRPESVTFSRRLADDLSRRDFTVNAMAYSQKSGLVDLFGGCKDIENGIIRCVGEPDRRFDEDALRILRALRFSSTLGFDIEEETRSSILKNAHLLKAVSSERIRDELEKAVCGKRFTRVLEEYKNVFSLFLGDIDTSLFLERESELVSRGVRLALLFCATDGECISRLKFSGEDTAFYKRTRKLFFEKTPATRYEIKKCIFENGMNPTRASLELKGESRMLSLLDEIVKNGECVSKKDLKINGGDLISLGFEQGVKMGQLLDSVFDLVLRGELSNDYDSLSEYVKGLK